MSSRDGDARILEQFLRTMAPPAALTASYRQRVVLASLEARTKVLQQRRLYRLVIAGSVCACLMMGALGLGILAVVAQQDMIAQTPADTTDPAQMNARPPTADGFESNLIQSQLPMRLQTWAAAHQGMAP